MTYSPERAIANFVRQIDCAPDLGRLACLIDPLLEPRRLPSSLALIDPSVFGFCNAVNEGCDPQRQAGDGLLDFKVE